MHNFWWYDVTFDSLCRTVRLCGIELRDDKGCPIYRHWRKMCGKQRNGLEAHIHTHAR